MRRFHLEIATPDGKCFDGEAESILLRTDDGDIEILAGHADFLASLSTGRARIITEAGEKFASVCGGFVSVSNSNVKVAAITFEFAENIDLSRAKQAKERAEAVLSSANDEKQILLAKAKLARALSRINVAELK